MSIIDILIFFLIIWWPIFFMLLPVGFEPITKYDKETEYVKSAPNKPKVIKKMFLASVISIFITFLIWVLEYYGIFSLKGAFLWYESK